MSSKLAKQENIPASPFQLFEDFLKEASTHSLEGAPPTFTFATSNKSGEVLNRTIVLRGRDENGFIFITEKNSRKFKDMTENPNVAATFYWVYRLPNDPDLVFRQIRIRGTVSELPAEEVAKFYETEPLHYKIRSQICKCGQRVDWEKLKKDHDELLEAYKAGKAEIKQNESYTALRITPKQFDFYFNKGSDSIADIVVYEQKDGSWINYRVYA